MSIQDFYNHSCDIYHMLTTDASPGYGLPASPNYDYPVAPDVCNVASHFNESSANMVQEQPNNNLVERIKLNLPIGTDVRLLDRVVNKCTSLEYTVVTPPRDIRGHHITVYVERRREQLPL